MTRKVEATVRKGLKTRKGKGFSISELTEVGLNPGEARRIGVPVDTRRSSAHKMNIEVLKEYIDETRGERIRVPKPKMVSKPKRRRVNRGLTSAGKRMRGLNK